MLRLKPTRRIEMSPWPFGCAQGFGACNDPSLAARCGGPPMTAARGMWGTANQRDKPATACDYIGHDRLAPGVPGGAQLCPAARGLHARRRCEPGRAHRRATTTTCCSCSTLTTKAKTKLLSPKLLERQPDSADVILRIAAQHQNVLTALAAAETAVEMWRGDPSAARRADAGGSTGAALDVTLVPHLDEEEREVLPWHGASTSPSGVSYPRTACVSSPGTSRG